MALTVSATMRAVGATQVPEAVDLSSSTFDKVVSRFPTALILFSRSYPYGPEVEAFRAVAKKLLYADSVLVGLVEVKDYGEKENKDLAERFGLGDEVSGSDNKPVPVLILSGGGAEARSFRYKSSSGSFTAEELSAFIRDKSGNQDLATGFIPELDALAKALLFLPEKDKGGMGKLMAEAEAALEAVGKHGDKAKTKVADFYLALMRKVVKDGKAFLSREVERLEKVYKVKEDDKAKKAKEDARATKVAIVQAFLSLCPDCPSVRTQQEL